MPCLGGGLATVAAWQTDLTVGDVTVTSGEGWGNLVKFAQISTSRGYTIGIDTEGNTWAWGDNQYGQLGNGTTSSSSSSSSTITAPQKTAQGHKFVQISAGDFHVQAIDDKKQLWTWGGNNYTGHLGVGDTNDRNTPTLVKIQGVLGFKQTVAGFANGAAIDDQNQAWTWGSNSYGQLGNGNDTTVYNSTTPTQVVGGHKFTQIAIGSSHMAAIDTDGNIWTWGQNWNGQLGDGTGGPNAQSSIPVKVKSDRKFKQIAAGGDNTIALDTTGKIWAWGANYSYSLGDGTSTQRNTPTQAKLPNDHTFTQISIGSQSSKALDDQNQAWAWGDNRYGQVGDGTAATTNNPIQVKGGHKFSKISAYFSQTIAIDTTGQAWGWGSNSSGQLGDNDTRNYRTLPTKIVIVNETTQP